MRLNLLVCEDPTDPSDTPLTIELPYPMDTSATQQKARNPKPRIFRISDLGPYTQTCSKKPCFSVHVYHEKDLDDIYFWCEQLFTLLHKWCNANDLLYFGRVASVKGKFIKLEHMLRSKYHTEVHVSKQVLFFDCNPAAHSTDIFSAITQYFHIPTPRGITDLPNHLCHCRYTYNETEIKTPFPVDHRIHSLTPKNRKDSEKHFPAPERLPAVPNFQIPPIYLGGRPQQHNETPIVREPTATTSKPGPDLGDQPLQSD